MQAGRYVTSLTPDKSAIKIDPSCLGPGNLTNLRKKRVGIVHWKPIKPYHADRPTQSRLAWQENDNDESSRWELMSQKCILCPPRQEVADNRIKVVLVVMVWEGSSFLAHIAGGGPKR